MGQYENLLWYYSQMALHCIGLCHLLWYVKSLYSQYSTTFFRSNDFLCNFNYEGVLINSVITPFCIYFNYISFLLSWFGKVVVLFTPFILLLALGSQTPVPYARIFWQRVTIDIFCAAGTQKLVLSVDTYTAKNHHTILWLERSSSA